MTAHVEPLGRRDLTSFCEAYARLLRELLRAPTELNERTGTRVSVLPGGVSFGVDLSDRLMPTCGLRKTFPRVAAAEFAWYVGGEQDASWMSKYAPIWDKFVEPLCDANGAVFTGVAAAYGYRWRRHFGRDQLGDAVQALLRDYSSRRVLVSAWDPGEDGLLSRGQKNVPCPAMFTLSVTDRRLHSTMLLRSSDVFVGLPYDVLGHALLMDAVACELGVELGVAHFSLAHAHLYKPHFEMAEEAVEQSPLVPAQPLPGWRLSEVEKAPDAYVERVKEASARFRWPTFSPRPEVVA